MTNKCCKPCTLNPVKQRQKRYIWFTALSITEVATFEYCVKSSNGISLKTYGVLSAKRRLRFKLKNYLNTSNMCMSFKYLSFAHKSQAHFKSKRSKKTVNTLAVSSSY